MACQQSASKAEQRMEITGPHTAKTELWLLTTAHLGGRGPFSLQSCPCSQWFIFFLDSDTRYQCCWNVVIS